MSGTIKKYNRNDFWLALFVCLQVFGLIGGALAPVRVFSILFVPIILKGVFKKQFVKEYGYELVFFYVFLAWAFISSIFAQDRIEAVKETLYLASNFIMLVGMLVLAGRALNPRRAVIYGWILFCIILFPLSVLEIFYNFHLSSSVLEADHMLGGVNMVQVYSATTFGNYNFYNVLLLFALPFLTGNIFLQKKAYSKILMIAVVLFLVFIVIINGSRGGLISLGIGMSYFLYKYFRSGASIVHKGILVLLLGVVVVYVMDDAQDIFYTMFYRVEAVGFTDAARSDIYSASVEMLLNSSFLGVGSGNFQVEMSNYNVEVIAPHNLFMEILVQYGIFIFLGFLVFMTRIYMRSKKSDNVSRYIVTLALVTFPIVSIINSTYLQGVNIWIYFASLIIIAQSKRTAANDFVSLSVQQNRNAETAGAGRRKRYRYEKELKEQV